ncbi:hypothetical protein Patl1_21975 [Pistacia atlantica]|uniref:Uncharacterized protein n=1 Tax=Pistacia atlantica TaxID=434234 RepID=A0ACC1BL06_9ROSI|nr:hypothetical protein Patl1_21975 [Pistacia atlantica]
MEGGTEAFPDLGRHCQLPDCHQLDFLPFTCDGCQKVFCLEHRLSKSHEWQFGEGEKIILERHQKSGDCDPSKKKKPTCSVKRCKQILTFSNTATCKTCNLKVCLKHRFPADHSCKKDSVVGKNAAGAVVGAGRME